MKLSFSDLTSLLVFLTEVVLLCTNPSIADNVIDTERRKYTDRSQSVKRQQDESLPAVSLILGRNVTCGEHKPGLFPAKTFTCADIRVDGRKLAFGYYPGRGVNTQCDETEGKHEFQELCRILLRQVGVRDRLYAVYVPETHCERVNEPRVRLNRTSTGYAWENFKPGVGWAQTIQCMLEEF